MFVISLGLGLLVSLSSFAKGQLVEATNSSTADVEPRMFLNMDCYRLRNGSRVMEGLGSIFREVRAARVFAKLLGMQTLETTPSSGHGGSWQLNRDYFGGLMSDHTAQVLKRHFGGEKSVLQPSAGNDSGQKTGSESRSLFQTLDDLNQVFVKLRERITSSSGTVTESDYDHQRTTSAAAIRGRFTVYADAINSHEVLALIEWLGGSTNGRAHNKHLPRCMEKSVQHLMEWQSDSNTGPSSSQSTAAESVANLRREPACREKILRYAGLERLIPRIKKLKSSVQRSGNIGILTLVSDLCPTMMYNARTPELDRELWEHVRRSRKCRVRNAVNRFSLSIHIRMGDLLKEVLVNHHPDNSKGRQTELSLPKYSEPDDRVTMKIHEQVELTVTTGDILNTLNRTHMIDASSWIHMKRMTIDRCVLKDSLTAEGTKDAFDCHNVDRRRTLKYPVRFYHRVLRGLFSHLPVLKQALDERNVDIHVLSDAPGSWFQSFQAVYGDAVKIHGDGDGRSLVHGQPSDLDYLIFSDILVYGEGNLGRMAGLLNPAGLILQPDCYRTGNIDGDLVMQVRRDGGMDYDQLREKFEKMFEGRQHAENGGAAHGNLKKSEL